MTTIGDANSRRRFWPTPIPSSAIRAISPPPTPLSGVNADLAVSDSDAWIYRLGYNITLLGRIVFIAPPVIE